jgi:thioredoxin reductase (NADPH)
VCDAPFYRDQEVAVIGGGDTAIEEAIYLTKFASRVYVIHRRDQLRATPVIQERARANAKISFVLSTVVTEIVGGPFGMEKLSLMNVKESRPSELVVNGAFIFVGIQPNSTYLPTEIDRNAMGFIRTDQEMATSIPGVFAAGDIRLKELRQIVTAVGDGATAAFNAGKYIEHNFK